MQLNHKIQGIGQPVILLHGLFGALDNLGALARFLTPNYQVISVDLPNHGLSKHSETSNYQTMANDVIALLNDLNLAQVIIVGHSMGGKVAMEIALTEPQRVTGLIVADIAPVAYTDRHMLIFDALQSVDLTNLTNRKQAQQQLELMGVDSAICGFLLKNLVKTEHGFQWRCNLEGLAQAYPEIIGGLAADRQYHGPTLFIKGEQSDYIMPSHREVINQLFPAASAKIIHGTGHWLHAEKPLAFNKIVADFINKSVKE